MSKARVPCSQRRRAQRFAAGELVQCDVVQQGPKFGGVLRHKRLKVKPFSAPAPIKVDHPGDHIAGQPNTPRSPEPTAAMSAP
jgi:hypothetical protein